MEHTHHDHSDHGDRPATWRAALHATAHCATGCVSGEILGLVIGVLLGLGTWSTVALTTSLAIVFGLSLASIPLARSMGIGIGAALGIVWLGEIVSILTMEAVMNTADYLMGGMAANSLLSLNFWLAMAVAIPVGFVATLPVNYVMIARGLSHHDP